MNRLTGNRYLEFSPRERSSTQMFFIDFLNLILMPMGMARIEV